MQDVVLMEPRNRLPGTDGLAPQWDLPYDVSRDDSHGSRTSGEVQAARRGRDTPSPLRQRHASAGGADAMQAGREGV